MRLRFTEETSSPRIRICQNTRSDTGSLSSLLWSWGVPTLFQKRAGVRQCPRPPPGLSQLCRRPGCSGDRGASPTVAGVAATAHRRQGVRAGGKEAPGPQRSRAAGQVWSEGGCSPGCVPRRPSEAGGEYNCPQRNQPPCLGRTAQVRFLPPLSVTESPCCAGGLNSFAQNHASPPAMKTCQMPPENFRRW